VEEHFFIYDNYLSLKADWDDTMREMITSLFPSPVMSWFCGVMNRDYLRVVHLRYTLNAAKSPLASAMQGAYLFGSSLFLLYQQSRRYDFIDREVLMTNHMVQAAKGKEEEDYYPYITLLQLREDHRVVTRQDVDRHMHVTVFMPFIREVQRQCPDLIPRLFNLSDARRLIDSIVEEEGVDGWEKCSGGEEDYKDVEIDGGSATNPNP